MVPKLCSGPSRSIQPIVLIVPIVTIRPILSRCHGW
jgi:hypothetical protein